ncbi:EAL domain-containing protein [Salinarimonas soli]|nr:EAL domain-containing protein [Salinarimonas soli]
MARGTKTGETPIRRPLAYGLAAGLGLGAAAFFGPSLLPGGVSGIALGVALGLAGGAGGVLLWRRTARLQEAADKASDEIDTLSRRLIRLESRLAGLEHQGLAAGAEQRGTVAELTGEIALLGGLVKDLAVSVSAQDRIINGLVERARAAPPPPAAEPRPSAPVLDTRPATQPREEAPRAKPNLVATPARASVAPPPPPPVQRPPERPVERPVERTPEPAPDRRRADAVAAALRADRVEVYLQPVVALPQRKMRFYEVQAHLRLSEDEILPPAEFMPVLEAAGLTPELDAKMVARTAALARHLAARGSEAQVACPLAPASLRTPGFLRALGRVLESHPDVLGRLVLGISQRCWRTLDAETAGALSQLRGRGVAFALDRAGDLRLDPLALADRGVRFLKVPVGLLLRPDGADRHDYAMADFAAVLARAGIRLVAEGVEREGDVPDLIELDVPLAQGTVFAPSRAVRPEVLGGAPAAPAPAPAAPPPAKEKPGIAIVPAGAARTGERVPLRSLLRRAL